MHVKTDQMHGKFGYKMLTAVFLASFWMGGLGHSEGTQEVVAPFKRGDRVAFIGDSITVWGQYTSIVHLFFRTRFPDQKFETFNAAVVGDTVNCTRLRAEPSVSLSIKFSPYA